MPTYNERDRLEELVLGIFNECDRAAEPAVGPVEVIIVDDNSPDGTGAVADELAIDPRVRVIHRPGKLGLATAVLEGFAAAHGDLVAIMDADLSHPPALLVELCRTLEATGADICVGSRYVAGGGTRNWSPWRLMLSRLACWLAHPLTPVRDATSGFLVTRRERVLGVSSGTRGFKIGLELLVRTAPVVVHEVPYVFVGRTAGQSKMAFREGLRYLHQLATLHIALRNLNARKAVPLPQLP